MVASRASLLHPLLLRGDQGVVEVHGPLHHRVERLAVGAKAHVGEVAAALEQLFLLAS